MRNFFNGLRGRLLGAYLALAATGTVALLGLGWAYLLQAERERVEAVGTATLHGLEMALREPLSSRQRDLAQAAVDEAATEAQVLSVQVFDLQGGVIAGAGQPRVDGQALSANAWNRLHLGGGDLSVREMGVLEGALGKLRLEMDFEPAKARVKKVLWGQCLLLLSLLVGGLVALYLVLGRVVGPITSLSEVTRRIVEEGDLTQEVQVGSKDEVGVLAGHFKAMVERLREIPRTLSAQAAALDAAVRALETSTAAQSAVVTRQATALQETQVTAEEIRQTSQVASRSAEGILADIVKAEAAGQKGTAALEQSLQGLADILESVKATRSSIAELGERTGQIGGITGTVKDLADQSNMLALNAAIEAVRSGEHGKGFALVAREIRRLADQSIQSTERVREILETVRGAVGAAVAGSEEGGRKVETSLGQMRASADSLRSLAAVVQDSSAAVRQIATAVNQQNTGVNQVFAAVVDQNKMMEESVRQLDGTLKAVDSLKTVSTQLAAVLGQYKA